MARIKHTDASNASQGLRLYLVNLKSSGWPTAKAKYERLMALSRNARMKAYLAEFGSHFVVEAPSVPKGGNMTNLSRLTKAELIEMLSNGASEEATEEATPSAEGFVVGCTFSYRNGAGVAREHRIERISKKKGGTAFTNTGKSFRISTLERLSGDVVEIV